MACLKLKKICKSYPNGYEAVKNVSIDILDKEFIVLVGPSGCGKSTTLRMIAGLEEISSGDLYIDNQLVNDVHPKDRDIAMVFQNYALYPHMNVYDNMSFGLKLKKIPKNEIDKRVKEVAKILDLQNLLNEKPKNLSGGQRQRVALGRAIIRNPKVFLMDEPLSNLDTKLRTQLRSQISKLHKKLGATFIYVTHDQVEAMTMGDRIVVMKDGDIQQIGTPNEIYDKPSNLFVASFIGSIQMNFIDVHLIEQDNNVFVIFDDIKIPIINDTNEFLKKHNYISKEVILGVRPENIHIVDSCTKELNHDVFDAKVQIKESMGSETNLYLDLNGQSLVVKSRGKCNMNLGEILHLKIDSNNIHIFDKDNEHSIPIN